MIQRKDPSVSIPSFDQDFSDLQQIAPMGLAVAIQLSWSGPKYFRTTYPKEWVETYNGKSLFAADPVFYWSMTNSGTKRWSELGLPDVAGIFRKAGRHGLEFGAITSIRNERHRSFISAARSDREFQESELRTLDLVLPKWLEELKTRKTTAPS